MRLLTYTEALREALAEEMSLDRRVILIGEDIGVYGGAFGVTRGLLEKFGHERIIETPISENSFVGMAIGAALTGLRPVVEIMFMDFITLAMDQIVNQSAKLRYVLGKQAKCPIVIRTPAGGGRCYGPTHSQTLTAWFVHTPGLKVVAPATPADAKILLKSSIRDDNPVVFVEHKLLYPIKGHVPAKIRTVEPLGHAKCLRKGTDITIIAWSWQTQEALQAVDELALHGINAELIDLRSLKPIDIETVVESVKRTHRVLITGEEPPMAGVASEIAAQIFEHVFDYLDASIRRLCCPDTPMPASPFLEKIAIPDRQKIVHAVLEMMGVSSDGTSERKKGKRKQR